MESYLDRLHASARGWPVCQRLAVLSRILLAAAFIPTGMVKLLGNRFTLLGPESPVGAYFEAIYQTGFYWNFLGLGQVAAGILLLIPATSTLGAVMFLPIIMNIAVVTWSIGFGGTRWITLLMLLASVFLVCWDYDRVKAVLFAPASRPVAAARAPLPAIEKAGYLLGCAAVLVVLLALRDMAPPVLVPWMLGLGALSGLLVLVGWVQASRRPVRASA